jgi:hypothetical protein
MAKLPANPKLMPRAFMDGSGWFVQATWEDGSRAPEQIGGFSSDSEARDWIRRRSAAHFKIPEQ